MPEARTPEMMVRVLALQVHAWAAASSLLIRAVGFKGSGLVELISVSRSLLSQLANHQEKNGDTKLSCMRE
jgi:hypothetical protein